MQKGEAGQPGLLFVHPVGGDVLCYQDLRQHWPTATPIYGLRNPAVEADVTPETDLTRLLELFAMSLDNTGIRTWTLVGQSLGGALALALAERLRTNGYQVLGLVMLDSFHPGVMKTSPDELLPQALGLRLPTPVIESVDFSTDAWIDNVYNYAKALNLVPADLTLDRIKRIYRVARANEALVQQVSVPAQVSYPVLHVAAEDNSAKSPVGWQGTSLAIDYREHAGNHETVMRGANAASLARLIQGFLQQGLDHPGK
jgi:thioesterase domain-containing protein